MIPRENLSDEETADIIAHLGDLTDLNDRRFMALLMFTPLRPGEILALEWSHLQCAKAANGCDYINLNVKQSLEYVGTSPKIKPPKTANGVRDFPIDIRLLDYLAPVSESGLIFTRDEGKKTQLYTGQTYKRMWERIKRTINVHGMVPYEGRHTYLSAMEREGMTGTSIQRAAGHAKLSTTQNNYIHPDLDIAKKEGTKRSARFDRMQPLQPSVVAKDSAHIPQRIPSNYEF